MLPYLSFRSYLYCISAIVALAVAIMLLHAHKMNGDWQNASDDLTQQVNALGASLDPGEIGIIHVPETSADELVFLPAYCADEDLNRHFPNRVKLCNKLAAISKSDIVCPAFIWLQGGDVAGVTRAKFTVGVNASLRSWELECFRDLTVVKEKTSLNSFLSLSFLVDP